MAVHVDLSEPELDPEAVASLVVAQTQRRPSQNVLFKVSRETFNVFREQQLRGRDPVRASDEETLEMNQFLENDWDPSDYIMGVRSECSNCGRLLSFYDVFSSGRERHGDDFLRRILSGSEFHLQVAEAHQETKISCSNCGSETTFNADDAGHTYHSGNYCYA
jgi:hypothetical protein